jgi:hypothetical protein
VIQALTLNYGLRLAIGPKRLKRAESAETSIYPSASLGKKTPLHVDRHSQSEMTMAVLGGSKRAQCVAVRYSVRGPGLGSIEDDGAVYHPLGSGSATLPRLHGNQEAHCV